MTARTRWPLLAGLVLAAACVLGLFASLASRSAHRAPISGGHPSAAPAPPEAVPALPRAAAEEVALQREDPAEAPAPPEEASAPREPFDPTALCGTVFDMQGEVIAGASVHAWSQGNAPLEVARASTDIDGRFRMRGLVPMRTYDLLCGAEGYLPKATQGTVGTSLTIELEGAAPLAGVLLDTETREPLEDIELALAAPRLRDGQLVLETVTASGRDGTFAFPAAKLEGTLQIVARSDSLIPMTLVLSLRPGVREGYQVRLPARREIALAVREADSGRPFADGAIEVSANSPWLVIQTDASGRARVQVAARLQGPLDLQVGSEGWCTTIVEVGLDASREPIELSVPLSRGLRVSGRVLDEARQPVAGASLHWNHFGKASLPGVPRACSARPANPHSDSAGSFDVTGLVPSDEPLTLSARHEVLGYSDWYDVVLPPYGKEAWVELILIRGAVIEGRVTAGNAPVGGRVHWQYQADYKTQGVALLTDAGEYRIPYVPPGNIDLAAERPDFPREHPTRLRVQAGETYRQDLDLGGVPGTIYGQVLDPSGSGAASVRVEARAHAADGTDSGVSARTKADGSFALDTRTSEREFTVFAAPGEMRGVELAGVVPGGDRIELRLQRTGSVRLSVVDAQGSAPLSPIQLQWKPAGAVFYRTWLHDLESPDEDGSRELEFPAGFVDLRVSAPERCAPALLEGIEIEPMNLPCACVSRSSPVWCSRSSLDLPRIRARSARSSCSQPKPNARNSLPRRRVPR